jgi:hypothetical protein
MKLSLGALVVLALSLAACGKKSPPPPEPIVTTMGNEGPPPATPAGVIGCRNFMVAIPDETKTQYLVLSIDDQRYGPTRKQMDFSYPYPSQTMVLEVFDAPLTGEQYCTDYATEPQRAHRYFAVEGKVDYARLDNHVRVVVKNARFVDRDGHIIDVAERRCNDVEVGWFSG